MKHLLTLLLALIGIVGWGQCDVVIVPGSIEVIDNEPGIQFQFEIQNNSAVPYSGGTLKMGWTLGNLDPIWNFNLTTPIQPGETYQVYTPKLDIPAVWDVDDYTLGINDPNPTNPWLESQNWYFYTQPFPFEGSWAPFKLYLGNCLTPAWVVLPDGELYYGPITDGCENVVEDQFCDLDCDLQLVSFDENGFTLLVNGSECYNLNQFPPLDSLYSFITTFSVGNPSICTGNVNYVGFEPLGSGESNTFGYYEFATGGNFPCLDNLIEGIENGCWVTLGINNPNIQNPAIQEGTSLTIQGNLDCSILLTAPDIGIDSLGYQLGGCFGEPLYWIPQINLTNYGDEVVTELCLEFDIWNVAGVDPDTICFNNLNILPGQSVVLELPQNFNGGDDQLLITTTLLSSNGSPEAFGSNNTLNSTFIMWCYDCTDPTAINYNEFATNDDGSCIYDIYGCTDPLADNYNPEATIDDGSCTYTIPGCTDPSALNFDPEANEDDGSCEYNVFGCTDEDALNFDPNATADDGSCIYPPPFDPCDDVEVFAPNTFTPNNDGLNDAWYVITDKECWREWHAQIFNRWGSLVWESFNPDDVWTGSNNGSDYFVADGVYVYTIIGNKWNTEAVTTSGHITILR